ncbi:MAG: hypothetical protein HDR80_00550 [Bacteroides sp.]|nr:hypothetical protein [Bacteroides sp.]
MAKLTEDYKKDIVKALRKAGRYSTGLTAQVVSLAGALRTLDMANDDIDALETCTITTVSRYGNETLAPHPVFKIQKDAQDSVTRQMKALGLTAEQLTGSDDSDPLYDLTKKVLDAGRKADVILRRDAAHEDEGDA